MRPADRTQIAWFSRLRHVLNFQRQFFAPVHLIVRRRKSAEEDLVSSNLNGNLSNDPSLLDPKERPFLPRLLLQAPQRSPERSEASIAPSSRSSASVVPLLRIGRVSGA